MPGLLTQREERSSRHKEAGDDSEPKLCRREPIRILTQRSPSEEREDRKVRSRIVGLGRVYEINQPSVSEKGRSAKATEAEAGQRPVPPRATPAQLGFPLTRRAQAEHRVILKTAPKPLRSLRLRAFALKRIGLTTIDTHGH